MFMGGRSMSKGLREPARCCALAAALAVSLATARADDAAPIQTLEPGVLKVCLYSGFAPFASKDASGNWQGWDVDYLKEFAASSQLRFEVVEKDFDGIWLQPGNGVCDIAGTGISDTEDRRKAAGTTGVWSNTYYHVVRAFLVRTADFTKLTRIEDLRGKKVIITKGSTANSDLCYRMKERGIHPCVKADGDHPCSSFKGLENFKETARTQDRHCVFIEYPWQQEEKCAAADVAARKDRDQDPGPPFTYGGGYGSVQALACDSSAGGECPISEQALATVWPHCNMAGGGKAYAEPFSFVVRQVDTGLVKALNCYINNHQYEGTPIPVFSPPCATPPWTPAPDKDCPQ
jgi:hypothetical protein